MPALAGNWVFFTGCKLMERIPTIQTARLVLRPFEMGDAADVQRLAGDRAIADTTLNIPHPYADGMAEQWIAKHADSFANVQGITFAITRKPEGSLVGAIGLTDMIRGHRAELGYWIATSCWNQGYCTEAGQAILRFGFEDLALVRIHAGHIARNPASGRVMQKLGMRYEGRRRQHVQKWGTYEELDLYGILEQEWQTAVRHHPLMISDPRHECRPPVGSPLPTVGGRAVTDLKDAGMTARLHRATESDLIVVKNLVPYYIYDMSEYMGWACSPDGRFDGCEFVETYWHEAGKHAFILRDGGEPAGFVLVRGNHEAADIDYSIAEYFVLRKFRGRGVGERIAHQVFDHFRGRWMVEQLANNAPAIAFWRKVIARYAPFTESPRETRQGRCNAIRFRNDGQPAGDPG